MFLAYFKKCNIIGYLLSFLFVVLSLHLLLNESDTIGALLSGGLSFLTLIVTGYIQEQEKIREEVIKILDEIEDIESTFPTTTNGVWGDDPDLYTFEDGEEIEKENPNE